MIELDAIRYFALSDVGLRRKLNEDAYAIYDAAATSSAGSGRGLLFAVADGLGGHSCGRLASRMACRGLKAFFSDSFSDCSAGHAAESLGGLVRLIDRKIKDKAAAVSACEDMATTLSVLVVTGNWAVTAHVGDSRIYRLRKGKLEQLTSDHTFVQEMIDDGELTRESAAEHPLRNMLTRVLGTQAPLEKVDTATVVAARGDRWLLCSDGLYNMMSSETITAILKSRTDPKKCADKLLQEALNNGGRDNITVIVVDL